jgi:hypothetical protein
VGGREQEAGDLQTWFFEASGEPEGGGGEWGVEGERELSVLHEGGQEGGGGVRLGMVGPARELGKMMEAKLEESGDVVDREKEKRETFDKGVSVEAQYAFTKGELLGFLFYRSRIFWSVKTTLGQIMKMKTQLMMVESYNNMYPSICISIIAL